MREIKIEITKFEHLGNHYDLKVDGQTTFTCEAGDLRLVLYEIEKYLRLRFKEDLRKIKSKQKPNSKEVARR